MFRNPKRFVFVTAGAMGLAMLPPSKPLLADGPSTNIPIYDGQDWKVSIKVDLDTLKALGRLSKWVGEKLWDVSRSVLLRHDSAETHQVSGKYYWLLPVTNDHSRVVGENMDQPGDRVYRVYPVGPKPAIEALLGAGMAVNADEAWDDDWTLDETKDARVGEPFKIRGGDDHYIVSRDDDAWRRFRAAGGQGVLLVEEGLTLGQVLADLQGHHNYRTRSALPVDPGYRTGHGTSGTLGADDGVASLSWPPARPAVANARMDDGVHSPQRSLDSDRRKWWRSTWPTPSRGTGVGGSTERSRRWPVRPGEGSREGGVGDASADLVVRRHGHGPPVDDGHEGTAAVTPMAAIAPSPTTRPERRTS